MRTQSLLRRSGGWLAAGAVIASLLMAGRASALDVIDPTGAAYVNVTQSSVFAAGWGATNLFTYDVSGTVPGDVLGTTGEYAKSGGGTAYVAFEVGAVYNVGSVFYAQRFGSTTGDNMQRMSVWTSDTTPFTAADPGTPPSDVFALLPNTGAPKWQEYILTNTLVGRYFLLKLEQTTVGGNPGGNELRLGLAPVSPVIAVPPVSQNVYSGSTVKMAAQAAGVGVLSYQWQSSPAGAGTFSNVSDGGNVSGATTATLTLANVAVGTTDYRVVVSNANGTATSDPATLSVSTSAPIILSDISPSTLQQPAGYGFSFSVTVDGSQPVTYQWKHDGVDLVDDTRITGSHSNVLSIAAAKASDAGNYQLFVTNPYGNAPSSIATLTVIPSLPVLSPSGTLYADISDSSSFSSSFISSNLFKTDVTGLKPGSNITGSEYAKKGPGTAWVAFRVDTSYSIGSVFFAQRQGSTTGDNMQKMSIWTSTNSAFSPADPGTPPVAAINLLANTGTPVWREYFLTSSIVGQYFLLKLEQTTVTGNPGGNEFRLGLAQEAPAIGAPPADQQAYDGNTVQFSAVVSGAQPLRYQWQVAPAGSGSFTSLSDSTDISGSRASVLTLRNIPLADYDYRLIVTNTFGSATSSPPARLTVTTSAPQIVSDLGPLSLEQPAGYAFRFAVQATGSGPMTFQWLHDGAALQDGGRISGSHSSVLTVTNAQAADQGNYQLIVNNQYGTGNSSQAAVTIVPDFGLGDGSAWGLNGGASVDSGILSITEAQNSQTRSAFFRTPVSIASFVCTFTYQDVSGGGADGIGFVLQNDPAGVAALGPGGGGLGYYGITPSAALLFNVYSGAPGGRGIAFETNGMTPEFAGTTFASTAPVDLGVGDPIAVVIRYVSGSVSLSLTDMVNSSSFTTNVAVNLPAAVGGSTAYLGFSGATGGVVAQQQISNVTFANVVPLSIQRVGANVVISWPVGPVNFALQYCTDLSAGVWQTETASATQVGNNMQVTVSAADGIKFYRLGRP